MKNSSRMTIAVPILMFGLFAVLAVIAVLFGAEAYRTQVETAEQNADTDTSLSYIRQKVHAFDTQGSVILEGNDTLVLEQNSEGTVYTTRIYVYDSSLWECFAAEGADLSPDDGTRILELKSLYLEEVNSHLLRAVCTDKNGDRQEALISVRTAIVQE